MTTTETALSASLRSRVIAEIEGRWVRPDVADFRYWVPADKVDEVARAALDTMLVRNFRVSKLPDAEEYGQLLDRVRHWVKRGKPICVRLGYAPMKNPRAVPHSRCDWAEFFTFCHLATWHRKVQTVYPPGLRISLIFDDATVLFANRVDRRYIDSYINSIKQLIQQMGYQKLICHVMRHTSFSWLFHLGLFQLARRRIRRWEQEPANREQIETMVDYARRNILLPADLSEQQQRRLCEEASHRYRVYFEALRLSGLSQLGHNLIAMYMDGAQHHAPINPALHLATLSNKMTTQPWQGEGALEDNGRGKLVPYVITQSRANNRSTDIVYGLGCIPLPGFDRIKIARASQAPAEHAATNGIRVVRADSAAPARLPHTKRFRLWPRPPIAFDDSFRVGTSKRAESDGELTESESPPADAPSIIITDLR